MHVLILGARAPVCLEWARAFHACGWRVTAADSIAWPLTRFSKAIDRYVRLPEPRRDPATWIDALLHEVAAFKIDLVLPTCEEAFYLSHGMKRFPDTCRVVTSEFALMHAVHHKGRFAALTVDWAITAPETRLLESPTDVSALTHSSRDWVFKPAYSRFASRTLIRPDAVALSKVRPSPDYPWVAQRFVSGREYCSFSLMDKGQLKAHACYHPRYRVGRGSGIWFEPADPPVLLEFMAQFGQATGYTGQVGFDFIEDESGRFFVLECNPRGTSGVHLFDDQQPALVRALTGLPQDVLTATATPRMVELAMILFAAPGLWRQGISAWQGFAQDYLAASDVVVRAGDYGPLLAQVPALSEILWRMLTRRCGLLAATTSDIEWDGQSLDDLPA